MIHTPSDIRALYIVASLVIGAVVLFAMNRLHTSHGRIGERQAPRTAMLGLLATLFTAAMNLTIYSLVPERVDGAQLQTYATVAHIRNMTVYIACALDAAAFIQIWGGWTLRRRSTSDRPRWPAEHAAASQRIERLDDNLDLDDTAVRHRHNHQAPRRPPDVRH